LVCFAELVEGFSVFKGADVKDAADDSVKEEPRKDEDTEAERRRKEAEREIEVMLMVHPFRGLVSVLAKIDVVFRKI
jgi:hypothetical protein